MEHWIRPSSKIGKRGSWTFFIHVVGRSSKETGNYILASTTAAPSVDSDIT